MTVMKREEQRFRVTHTNDPRGKHFAVWDSQKSNYVVARAWRLEHAKELAVMHNNGSITPNYESRYINHDYEVHLMGR